jgi:kinesin family member 15
MMLKFREDKINRMEAIVKGEITPDLYLVEDNRALTNEIELLRNRVDRNPEVTRFALENIRLLDQIRRYKFFLNYTYGFLFHHTVYIRLVAWYSSIL